VDNFRIDLELRHRHHYKEAIVRGRKEFFILTILAAIRSPSFRL
jgi:hypothetical protein